MQSLILNVKKVLKSSLGVCATLPDCFCSSSRCFVLTSPDKNIGKRHCSAFPSVARLRAFSQAAEQAGNFLETWVDSQCTPLIFIPLGLFRKSSSSSYQKHINTGNCDQGKNHFLWVSPSHKILPHVSSGQIKKTKTKRKSVCVQHITHILIGLTLTNPTPAN